MMTSSRLATSVTRSRVAGLAAATALALSLAAAPAFAAEDVSETGDEAVDEAVETTDGHAEEEEGGKIQLAERPRDRVGLIVLGFLGAITVGGAITAARQMKGSRPQASGEFRWR